MFPVLTLGPLSLPTAPLLLLIGFWLGSSLAERKAKQAGKDPDLLAKIIWYALIAGILGARLSFIARNPTAFQGDLRSIFSLNQALLDPAGGLAISLGVAYFLASKNSLSFLSLLDELVPFFAVLAPALFLANFASGTGVGLLTDLSWGIDQFGGPRHPVQLYYLLSSLVVLYLISSAEILLDSGNGFSFLTFLMFTTGYLSFLYSFQDPLGNLLWGISIPQFISWVVFSLSILLRYKQLQKTNRSAPD